jgi:hypothetical protein
MPEAIARSVFVGLPLG